MRETQNRSYGARTWRLSQRSAPTAHSYRPTATALGAPGPGEGLAQCRGLAAKAVRHPGQHYGWGGCNSPRSTSHSGEEAPLHSLRGPNTGNIIPNSDRDTGLGRSRLPGLTTAENWSAGSDGLIGPELKLDRDWVSESSSDTKLLQVSSSKASEATRMRENTSHTGSGRWQRRSLGTSRSVCCWQTARHGMWPAESLPPWVPDGKGMWPPRAWMPRL